jgi:hypothetical protein
MNFLQAHAIRERNDMLGCRSLADKPRRIGADAWMPSCRLHVGPMLRRLRRDLANAAMALGDVRYGFVFCRDHEHHSPLEMITPPPGYPGTGL